MQTRILPALVFYYKKTNKFSFNPLIAALEQDGLIDRVTPYYFRNPDELVEGLAEVIEKHGSAIACISFFTPQIFYIIDLVTQIRERYGNQVLLIAGGPHATGDPEGTLNMGIDLVVHGEGEETLLEMIRNIITLYIFNIYPNNKSLHPKKIVAPEIFGFSNDSEIHTSISANLGNLSILKNIKGICFKDESGNFVKTGSRPPIKLDDFPPFPLFQQKFGPIEITRGCPYACGFCQVSHLHGGSSRHRSIASISRYLNEFVKRDLHDIRFITPNAFSYGSPDGKTLNIDALTELFSLIRRAVGPDGRMFLGSFPSEVRPNHVTPETVALVTKFANNDNIVVGAQSGSARMLEKCHRGHTVDDIYDAIDLIVKAKSSTGANLVPYVDFIFGLPGETEEDIIQTIEMMNTLTKKGARIHAHTFMPLPQTRFANAPAGKVSQKIRDLIIKMIPNRTLFGAWEKQEKLAHDVAEYLKKN